MIRLFPVLFSRTSKGKVQRWQIIVKDDYFYTESGYIDGTLVTSKPNLCKPMNVGRANETTAHEQALAEAQSKWEKKIKADYKEDMADIDKLTFVEPMLAKSYKDRLNKVTYPVIVDRKYNGGRIVITANGAFSRKGERWETIPHIIEELSSLFKEYPDLVLDGEGYNHEYRFKLNDVMSILRKEVNITAEDLAESKDKIKYYIYDGYGFDNINKATPQVYRREAIFKLVGKYKYVVPVTGVLANTQEEVYKIYQEFVDDGYEGAMVRIFEAPYKNGRSSDLLKVKPEDDSEGIIKAIHEGSGNWSGVCKTMTLAWRGMEFDASFKGDRDQARKFLEDERKWLGKEVTFLYNGLTGLGKPNYARVDINNCLKKK